MSGPLELKWVRVLNALISGRSWNRYEAARELADHCLHTTVAIIQRKGVPIARSTETVPGYMGVPTDVCRYWLDPANRPAALALIERTRGSRKADVPSRRPKPERCSVQEAQRSTQRTSTFRRAIAWVRQLRVSALN